METASVLWCAFLACVLAVAGAASGTGPGVTPTPGLGAGEPPSRPLSPVPFARVGVDGPFWDARMQAVREGVLGANEHQCDITGRLANFDKAAGAAQGEFEGLLFNDSDVYKMIEGWCYVLASETDKARRADLEERLDALIARIAAAQQPDGYINTYYTVKRGLAHRWSREQWDHESYCIGHLIEAGVAHAEATGKRTLLDVAIRAADHVASVFGPGKLEDPSGHQEIEIALIKLARHTKTERYLDLARFFIEQRGKPRRDAAGTQVQPWGDYAQDHVPLRQQMEAAGHAVRAAYWYSSIADLAMARPDPDYVAMLDRIWDDVTRRRMYVTGGIGPSAHNEGFTIPFDLPNFTAYQETCASIALAMWAHRMHLLHADARAMDIFERSLYNAILAGVSLDGAKFFYVNPLASRGTHQRQDWFACACCPPNILRFLASIGGYVYSTGVNTVYANLFVPGTATIAVPRAGNEAPANVRIVQKTNYPWDGVVTLECTHDVERSVTLLLRRPGWCRQASITVNGQPPNAPRMEAGYIGVGLPKGATIVRYEMQMPVTRMYADPRVKANLGRVALQRGPLVYAFEEADNPDGLLDVIVGPGAVVDATAAELPVLGQLTVLRLDGERPVPGLEVADGLYTPQRPLAKVTLTAIPYFMWENRAQGDMVVWVPESANALGPMPLAGVKPSSSHCYANDSVLALSDRLEPENSGDHSIPRLTWWDHKGTEEWVQFDFAEPRAVGRTEVYWFDDAGRGGCRVPASWSVEYRDGDRWVPVEGLKGAGGPGEGCTKDRFNLATFAPVRTSGLRLKVKLQENWSGGMLEWRFAP